MLYTSVLQKIISQSVLRDQSALKQQSGGKSRFPIAASLMLTSLVDVFSILVIYLLVNTSGGQQDFDLKFDLQLPKAAYSDETKTGLMLSLKDDQFFIDDNPVDIQQIESSFKSWVETHQDNPEANIITIQADRNTDFEKINPVLERAAFAGIRNFQLATLREE